MVQDELARMIVETDAARSFVTFTIDPAARFSNGKPVTPEDVIFSWQLLRDHGRPNFGIYYSKVRKADKVGERGVRFNLAGAERDQIFGDMPLSATVPSSAALRELRPVQAVGSPEEIAEQYADAAKLYHVRVIPTQIFFDASGRELYRHEGFFSKKDILAKWKEFGVEFKAEAKKGTKKSEA